MVVVEEEEEGQQHQPIDMPLPWLAGAGAVGQAAATRVWSRYRASSRSMRRWGAEQ